MKKKIITLLIITIYTFISNNLYASTNTQTRTEDNLQIADDIIVTQSVINAAMATPKVDENEKIYDFAELLTEEEQDLYTDIIEFINEHNLDMAIVTIDDNNKYSAMDYADDFYDYNYFGKGTTHDGLLLLIDMDTRDVYISTTGQAMLIYDDIRIDNMLDYIAPKLTSEQYDYAVSTFINYADNYATSGIPLSNKNYYIDSNGDIQKKASAAYAEALTGAVIFGTVATIIFIMIGVFGHRNVKKANKARLYLDKKSVDITDKKDTFLHTNTTKVRIESSSSGGGSSSHRSSSGRSHGGGGRSF